MEQVTINHSVLDAVTKGLEAKPKSLPSWLFYDENGDAIFQQIMDMPEYYLTRCEFEIIQNSKSNFLDSFQDDGKPFHLVELGAGDGIKTEVLLKYFIEKKAEFTYHPIDISEAVLEQLKSRMKHIEGLNIEPICMNYEDAFDHLKDLDGKKAILFMGANIGNYPTDEAHNFIKLIANAMDNGDRLLIGFDLIKNPDMIRKAYNDPSGITKAFNINLLLRLNQEFGAQFLPDQFDHYGMYDPTTGTARSFLVSLREQDVWIDALDKIVHFDRWELIHTEVSQKYSKGMIQSLAKYSGLDVKSMFFDCKHYFCDVLLGK